MKKTLIAIIFLSHTSMAFVSGPGLVDDQENYLSLGSQIERGKIEPNENKASYQDAQINMLKLKYIRGHDGLFGLSRSNIYFEYGYFNSVKEQIGSTLFYEKDPGHFFTAGFSGDIIYDLEKKVGLYLQVSPIRTYNKNKFSNPRLDLFALGLTSAFDVTNYFFQRNLIHFGSGDGSDQNSYLAIDTGFGYRLNHLLERQFTISGSLFLEADTSERNDPIYDSTFSQPGSPDRVRAFKYGTLVGADIAVTKDVNLTVNYLQKLGGYDARSTQIYTLNVGFKF